MPAFFPVCVGVPCYKVESTFLLLYDQYENRRVKRGVIGRVSGGSVKKVFTFISVSCVFIYSNTFRFGGGCSGANLPNGMTRYSMYPD